MLWWHDRGTGYDKLGPGLLCAGSPGFLLASSTSFMCHHSLPTPQKLLDRVKMMERAEYVEADSNIQEDKRMKATELKKNFKRRKGRGRKN